MNAEQSVLDRIDEVTVDTCHAPGCDRSLDDSVSDWFCSAPCQSAWQAHHNDVQEIVGYREAMGDGPGWGYDQARWRPGGAVEVQPLRIADWSSFREAAWSGAFEAAVGPVRLPVDPTERTFAEMSQAIRRAASRIASAAASDARTRPLFTGVVTALSAPTEDPVPDPDPARTARVRALAARQNRNTGPQIHADPRRNRGRP